MGQYHMPINFDKKELIHPHKFGNGLKMLEFGCSANGVLTGLTLLLANSHNRGGGDLHIDPSENDVVGRWAGDRIAILGDYSELEDFEGANISKEEFESAMKGVWGEERNAPGGWQDISESVLLTMMKDGYVREDVITTIAEGWFGSGSSEFIAENDLTEEVETRKAELKKERAEKN